MSIGEPGGAGRVASERGDLTRAPDSPASIVPDEIDADAQKVVRRLTRSGFSAYFVGGCVRDLLLGRTPKDFDIATSATPPEIKALFRNCRIIGRRFRLAHIFFGAKIIETSTFRANPTKGELVDDGGDAQFSSGNGASAAVADAELLIRRDNVFGTAEEDARRRDFTINGLFYDLDEERVIDYVEGLPDLASRTVRTIGDPDIRFREDPIRMLRAIKFAARLDFTIAPPAYRAILTHKDEIAKCAPPRVLEEIYRLFRAGAARNSLELLHSTGVLQNLIPELAIRLEDRSGRDAKERLLALLLGLDQAVVAGMVPSNALTLGVLLSPFVGEMLELPGENESVDPVAVLDAVAAPLLQSMRVSRRDGERVRQILMAQRKLAPSRRRRGRPMALVRRDWFAEALLLFELRHPQPTGEIAEEIARWHRLEGGVPSTLDGEAGVASETPNGRRRRRRRRGGRRRGRGSGTSDTSAKSDHSAAAKND